MLRILFIACSIFLSTAAAATISDDRNTPEFSKALASWLDGDDASALQTFATLSREGNTAAQTFLAQIEVRSWLHAQVTGSLTRQERIALLRNPSSKFGTSWLKSAAQTSELARLIQQSRNVDFHAETGAALFDRGEIANALPLVRRLAFNGDVVGSLQLALHPNAIPFTSGYIQPTALSLHKLAGGDLVDLEDPRLDDIIARLGTVPTADLPGNHLWRTTKNPIDWFVLADRAKSGKALMRAPTLAPLVDLLQPVCAENTPEALGALNYVSPDSILSMVVLSPLETIVSSKDYQASARFEGDVTRRFSSDPNLMNALKKSQSCAHQFALRARP